MRNDRIQVDRIEREVIEGKLLASLSDDSKVAIVLSEPELSDLIEGLMRVAGSTNGPSSKWKRFAAMADDLKKLRREAFGR